MVGSLAVAVLIGAGIVGWRGISRPARTAGAMENQAYIWQRAWTPAVRQAVISADSGGDFAELVALGAEITPNKDHPVIQSFQVDRTVLAKGKKWGVALRIGPYAGPFDESGPLFEAILSVALGLLEAPPVPDELQIDFDCPESKLGGYARWLAAIQRRTDKPVVITALPSWLDGRAFTELARASPGYVLQVHSLRFPSHPGEDFVLCDPREARRAVERAASIGVPFRVALPTYGYLAAFDPAGKLLGLSAEQPLGAWPADATIRAIRADPAAMADLVASWRRDRPELLRSILWYRLPVPADQLNWRTATLQLVMRGQRPTAVVEVAAQRRQPGLVEISIVNSGSADAELPQCIQATWPGEQRPIAGDAVNGYLWLDPSPGRAIFRAAPHERYPETPLRPGESRNVGWIRLPTDTEVHAHVVPVLADP